MSFTETRIFTKSICLELNASSGTAVIPIVPVANLADYDFDPAIYSIKILGRRLLELSAISRITSIPESLPPDTENLTDMEASIALREWNFSNPRKQVDLSIRKGGPNWIFRGSVSFPRVEPYLDQPIVGAVFNENSNFEDLQEIGLQQIDAGSGLLTGSDKITISGSYAELIEITKTASWIVATASPAPTPTPTPDTTAPTALIGSLTDITTENSSAYVFTVTYSDNAALDLTSLGSTNIRVTGTNGYNQLAALVSSTPSADSKSAVVTYQVTPPGSWDSSDNGTFTISVEANQVKDTSNNYVVGGALGTFTVNVSASAPTTEPETTNLGSLSQGFTQTLTFNFENGVQPSQRTINFSIPTQSSVTFNFTQAGYEMDFIVYQNGTEVHFNTFASPYQYSYTFSASSTNYIVVRSVSAATHTVTLTLSVTSPPVANPSWLSATGWVASSNFNNAEANRAIDSSLSTYWGSNAGQTTSMYWQVDLGTTRTISKVDITEPSGDVGQGNLQVSLDGTNWTNIKTAIGFNTLQEFTAVSARHIRLQNNQNAGAYWRLTEVEVYGY